MTELIQTDGHLTGMLLVAMPTMGDSRFAHSVIYMCAHSPDGAMGIVINQVADNVDFSEVVQQLDITVDDSVDTASVHHGGPVETSRGFVLHSPEYITEGTLEINESFSLTATLDILQDIAGGRGPAAYVLALGYAGWSPGQLDREIQENGWLTVPAEPGLVFDADHTTKWQRAFATIGVDPSLLSGVAGHA